MDKQAIEIAIISISAIGIMRAIEFLPSVISFYGKYPIPIIIAFLLLIVFARKMVNKL